MVYAVVLILLSAGLLGCLAALLMGIVSACRKRWRRVLISLAVLLFCGIMALGAGLGLVVKSGMDFTSYVHRQVAAANARDKALQKAKVDAIKALTPKIDWTKVDRQYWEYEGFRDWFRVPIRWPYEIASIDTRETGHLRQNTADGKSDDPNHQTKNLDLNNITHCACDSHMLLFRRAWEGSEQWGLFEFDTEVRETFTTDAQMWSRAKDHGWTGPATLSGVKDSYDQYWSH